MSRHGPEVHRDLLADVIVSNRFQFWEEGPLDRATYYLVTARWLTLVPSFSGSPWMQRALQSALAWLMVRIPCRNAESIDWRPNRFRFLRRQNQRKLWQRQLKTASN